MLDHCKEETNRQCDHEDKLPSGKVHKEIAIAIPLWYDIKKYSKISLDDNLFKFNAKPHERE